MSKLTMDVDGIHVECDGPDEAIAVQKDAAKVTVILPEPTPEAKLRFARVVAGWLVEEAIGAVLGEAEPPPAGEEKIDTSD